MPKINPRIKSIDDLLGLDAAEESPIEPTPSVSLPTKNTIITLPPQAIRAFRGHPFRLYEGDRLNDLVESISEHGVLNPAIIRKIERDEDGFEYGVSTVKRALDELVKAGYIVKQARFDERKNGGQTSNLYTLCSDLPCPDEPENAPVPEDDASDESPAVQPESAPADACNTPDPTPGEQSATLPTADCYSFADGFETKIGRQNCRPIRMWTGG